MQRQWTVNGIEKRHIRDDHRIGIIETQAGEFGPYVEPGPAVHCAGNSRPGWIRSRPRDPIMAVTNAFECDRTERCAHRWSRPWTRAARIPPGKCQRRS